jgi:hypothetical protein
MEIGFEVTTEGEDGLDKMITALKEIDGKKVSAGLFGGFAAQKAMWQEYGTSRGIPARPFLRNTLYQNAPKWSAFIAPLILQAMLSGNGGAIMSKLGQKMVDDIHRTIDAGNFAPLAPATIAKKGHAKPLIDSGDMYGSVEWREG